MGTRWVVGDQPAPTTDDTLAALEAALSPADVPAGAGRGRALLGAAEALNAALRAFDEQARRCADLERMLAQERREQERRFEAIEMARGRLAAAAGIVVSDEEEAADAERD